jgi:hypothetical protein
MSKTIVLFIVLLSAIPVFLFLFFGETKTPRVPSPQDEVVLPESATQEPRPGDSQSCAMCRQIPDSASQAQCLQDFACEL